MSDAIRVVDVPLDATAEQAEAMLNAPGEAFYVIQVLPLMNCHRAYLRRYAYIQKAEAAKDGRKK